MAYGTSWRAKDSDLDPRDVVEEAAHAAGMSVEEWLETAADGAFQGGSRSRSRRRNRPFDDERESPLTKLARRIERREGRRSESNHDNLSEDRVAQIVSDAVESFQDSLRANEERTAAALSALSRSTTQFPDHGPNKVRTLIGDIERNIGTNGTATPVVSGPAQSSFTRQIESRIESVLNNLEQRASVQPPPAPVVHVAPAPQIIERQNRDLRSTAAINAALAKVNNALRGLEQSPQQNEILKTLRSLDKRLSGLEQAPQNSPEVIGQMVGEMAALQHHMSKQRPGTDMSAVNKHMLSLGDRIDALTRNVGSQPAQSNHLAKQFTSQFERLTSEISELRASLKASPAAPDSGIETLRHQMASMGDNLNALTQKIAALRNGKAEDQASSRSIDSDLSELKRLVQVSQAPVHDERVFHALQSLENKIAAVERAPNDLSARLDRIQSMMGQQTVATLPPHVESLLQGLAGRLKEFENTTQDDLAFARLHEEVQQISRKLEQAPASIHSQAFADVSGLERSISAILQQVDGLKSDMGSLAEAAARRATQEALSHLTPAVQNSPADLSGVEQSIQTLFRQIDGWKADVSQVAEQAAHRAAQEAMSRMPVQSQQAQADLSGIEHSIQGLFRQMDAWKSDMGMVAEDAARRATSEAMRQVPAFSSNGGGAETAELQRALGDMQLSQKDAERRTTQTLEAVHDTLKRVVDRLVDMEKDIEAKAIVAPAPMPTPAFEQIAAESSRKPLTIQAAPTMPQPPFVAPDATAGWNNGQLSDGAAATVAAMRAQRMGVASPSVTTSPPSKGAFGAALDAARNAVSGIKLPSKKKSEPSISSDAPLVAHEPSFSNAFDAPLEPGSGRPQKGDATIQANDPKAKFLAAARQAAQAAAGHAADTLANESSSNAAKNGKKAGLKTKHALLLSLAALIVAVGATVAFTGMPKFMGGGKPKEIVGNIDHVRKQVQLSHQHRQQTLQTADANHAAPRQILTEIQDSPLPQPLAREVRSVDVARLEPPRQTVTSPETTGTRTPTLSDPVTVGSIVPNVQSNIRSPAQGQKPALSVSTDPLLQFEGLKDAPGLRAAARNGEVAAFIELGNRFADGRGAERNPKTAALWFERAAEQGSATARYRLGTFYREGKGVERNPKMALAHFTGAAELGNARAMHNTAVLLAEGVNGSPDYAGAAEWFKRAAEFGIRDSQYNLAILYARGLGTTQDLVASYSWFSAAATQGDEDSNKKRDEVGARLSPEQLKQAKEAAALWKAKKPDVAANEILPAPSSWDAPAKTSSPSSAAKPTRS